MAQGSVRDLAGRKARRKQAGTRLIPRNCLNCGATFIRRSDARFCSQKCRNVAIAADLRRARVAARTNGCVACGADISHRRADATTCSPKCLIAVSPNRRALKLISQQNREARKRNATVGYGVPIHEWRRILMRAAGRCAYCGQRRDLTMDHVVPLARGGIHGIGNVVAACGSCNSSKNDRLLIEWRAARGLFPSTGRG